MSSIVEVSMNKTSLQLVSAKMIGQPNELSLLITSRQKKTPFHDLILSA